jgi:L-alanine-DL-glutamate epimerase-like enolase superfamily enzyme
MSAAGLVAGTAADKVADTAADAIVDVRLSAIALPLATPVSDAKVLTGVQKPMAEVAILVAEVRTAHGLSGLGFSYATRGGGPAQFAHAVEIAPVLVGEDPNDIAKLWTKLQWAGASVGRSGVAVQAVAAIDSALWDIKARRAGLSVAKLLGSHHDAVPCYNSSGGYLHTPLGEVLDRASASLERGIGGLKLKVGQPDGREDIRRVRALRDHVGPAVPIMVDANQQWDRSTSRRMVRALEEFDLTWIEEPLDAYDVEGHRDLSRSFDTPIATGEMLTSVDEYWPYLRDQAIDILQPDAPRIGGITPFLTTLTLAERVGIAIAPHFVMELHLHLAAVAAAPTWIEHFEWLEPLFDERVTIAGGLMTVPTGPGLGLTLTEKARSWTTATVLVE